MNNEEVMMGSPISPVVANFYIESFELLALSTTPFHPLRYFHYLDDKFIVWRQGRFIFLC